MIRGSPAGLQLRLHLICIRWLGARTKRSLISCSTSAGLEVFGEWNRCNSYLNSSNSRICWKRCTSTISLTAFVGDGLKMAFTRLNQPTSSNSKVPSALLKQNQSGRHMLKANTSSLPVQAKILTADKLIQRHWPCDPIYMLCEQEEETAVHLCLKCPFTLQPPSLEVQNIEEWGVAALKNNSKENQKSCAGIFMYISWNIWKERNRRIFEGKSISPQAVLHLAKEEMMLR
ncbi:LOW QUALITY PROTEIN: hypothetical protein U9M48_026231, partial [Paspalum notatum var. saurae]